MPSNTCPNCDEQFGSSGDVHEHTWDVHGACHYCGEQFDDEEALYKHWLTTHSDTLSRVDRKRAESAVDSLTFTNRLSNQGVGAAVGGLRRRQLLLASGVAVVGGAGAMGTVLNESGPVSRNSGPASDTSSADSFIVPPSPAKHRYAVTGTGDAGVTVTYFGNWKCPYCAKFSTGFLPTLVTDYVKPGKINLKFRNLTYIDGKPFLGPDTPAAARAGLAVWNNDPASYWPYHEYVLRNQPPESKQWATADKLISFAQEVGVTDSSVIRTAIQQEKYESALRATSDAATAAGLQGTPVLLVDGTTVSPFDKKRTRRVIEDAID